VIHLEENYEEILVKCKVRLSKQRFPQDKVIGNGDFGIIIVTVLDVLQGDPQINKWGTITLTGNMCEINDEDIKIGEGANLGLGCGNPVAMSKIKKGDVVLDLGCGAGFDCFLASKKVGDTGKVIGIDMTEEMIARAKLNAEKMGVKNVEFILGEIEKLPVKDNSVDIIITNCVINLTPDKTKTFKDAYRVLKNGGKMYVSDIVLLKKLSKEQREDEDLLTSCVAGALLKDDYFDKIKNKATSRS